MSQATVGSFSSFRYKGTDVLFKRTVRRGHPLACAIFSRGRMVALFQLVPRNVAHDCFDHVTVSAESGYESYPKAIVQDLNANPDTPQAAMLRSELAIASEKPAATKLARCGQDEDQTHGLKQTERQRVA